MSGYPEDIMKAAQRAIGHMPDLKAMMDPSEFWEQAEEAVAAAILAERERCADIARNAQGPEEAYEAIMMGDA